MDKFSNSEARGPSQNVGKKNKLINEKRDKACFNNETNLSACIAGQPNMVSTPDPFFWKFFMLQNFMNET